MKIRIRSLQKSDQEAILKLLHEFWIDYNGQMLSDKLKKFEEYKDPQATMLRDFNKYLEWIALIAEEAGQIIGFIVGVIDPKEHKVIGKQGYIEEFFVTESKRGQGIGRKLYEALVAEFKKRDCKTLGIDSKIDNKKAIEFYRKLGFIDHSLVLVKEI